MLLNAVVRTVLIGLVKSHNLVTVSLHLHPRRGYRQGSELNGNEAAWAGEINPETRMYEKERLFCCLCGCMCVAEVHWRLCVCVCVWNLNDDTTYCGVHYCSQAQYIPFTFSFFLPLFGCVYVFVLIPLWKHKSVHIVTLMIVSAYFGGKTLLHKKHFLWSNQHSYTQLRVKYVKRPVVIKTQSSCYFTLINV